MIASLIGRRRELDEVTQRAHDSRLVTIIGPGGVGKTSLAAAAAEQLVDHHPLGILRVDLTRIDDPAAVKGALASQLGFDSFEALITSPADEPVLLVVDNCEHLLDAIASTVSTILGVCRQTTILATSRSPLDLPAESVFSLTPLPLPRSGEDPRTCASVELFLERCRDAGANVGDADLDAVVDLCRRLDGLPLAIEIAAARARTMSIREIATRLADDVDVLDRPRFRGDPRHRSVSSTIRWSSDLLSSGATDLLYRLGVFTGPFRVTAARAVTAQRGERDDNDVFDDALDELVHASLVVVDASGDETEYRLLDSVRRYALGRLTERGETAETYDRFVDHVLARSRTLVDGATTSWRPDLLRDLVATFDDVAEALRWCIANDATATRARRLCGPFWGIVHQGHADDIATLVRRVQERFPDDDSVGAAQAVAVLATAEYVTGNPAIAVDLASRRIAAQPQENITSVILHRVLGQARSALGDRVGAIDAFRAGAEIGHRLETTAMAHELEIAALLVATDIGGDISEALTDLRRIEAEARGAESVLLANWAATVRAWIEVRVDPDVALGDAARALAEARRIDYPIAVAVNLRTRAYAQLLAGDSVAAAASVAGLLDDLVERGALSNARLAVDIAAALAHRCGLPTTAELTATARSLPITTIAASQFELIPLPESTAAPLPRPLIVSVVRQVIAEVSAGRPETTQSARATIRRSGDLVQIDFDGRSISVKSSKGLTDLVRLVEAAGRELHCTELAGVAVDQASTGAVIDATARREYEQRIRDLQEEIDEAEQHNDYTRSYRLQVELDALIEHLSASLGRGGRTRRGTDTAERARSAVTHRIRATIRQLARLHPALGRHLDHSVSTGAYCAYRPERPVTWTIV